MGQSPSYDGPGLVFLHYNLTGRLRGRKFDPGWLNNNTNGSMLTSPPSLGTDTKTMVMAVVCALIVAENAAVLLALHRHRTHMRTATHCLCLMGNLAFADAVAAAAYCANVLLSGGAATLSLTPARWFAREGAAFAALAASLFSFVAIAAERHAAMIRSRPGTRGNGGGSGNGQRRRPHRGPFGKSGGVGGGRAGRVTRPLLTVGACWAVAVLVAVLPSLGWNCMGHVSECSTLLPLYARSYVAFCLAASLLALTATVVLYARLYRAVAASRRKPARALRAARRKISSSSSLTSSPSSRRRRPRRSLGLLRTLALVVGVFITCWSPLFALLAVDVACDSRRCPVLLRAADYAIALAVLNSATNPIIYAACSRDMRQAFIALVCCLRGERSHASRRGSSGSTSGGRSPSSISSSLSVRPGLAVGDAGATVVGAAKMVPSSLEDRDRVPYSPSFSCSSFSTSPSPSNNNNALASPSKVVVMMMVVATAKEATTDPPSSGVFVFPEPVKEEDVTVER
ncbi:sphingosine 1-phosphate receptor 3-like [Lethenteron reissneri]|uniref:sphingosine 1-phosphate receptor 3-like n=1 Tax=Lethenteron reissneri TaxID=7753 RepID=UPI002AB61365|nr:sphingosine 1-phosphate receptor 3-like [Lethenteron reissneri]